MKKKKSNIFLILLSPFKYFCLGCYYTLYGILYPFILIYNLISSGIYKIYASNKRKQDKKEVMESVNLEMFTIEEKIKKNQEIIDSQEVKKIKKEENLKQKKLSEKKLKERDLLISEINKHESVRTEYPNTYRYSARDTEGHDVTGFLVAYSKIFAQIFMHEKKK